MVFHDVQELAEKIILAQVQHEGVSSLTKEKSEYAIQMAKDFYELMDKERQEIGLPMVLRAKKKNA